MRISRDRVSSGKSGAFPAIANADWNRNAALMRNLDKMRERVKQLEVAVNDLKPQ